MTRFQVNKCNLNINQYIPVLLEGTTNVLFAIAILVVGLFIANKAKSIITRVATKYQNLDDTLSSGSE